MKQSNECRQCPKCFSIELPSSVFCSKCGRKLKTTNQPSATTEKLPRFIVIGGVVFAVLIFLIGLNVFVELVAPTQKQQTNLEPSVITSSTPEIKPETVSFVSDSKSIEGKVIAVLDGDTITVLGSDNKQYKVRLAAIDAPEAKQDFGDQAKQNLSELIDGKNVRVVFTKTDKDGRITGKVLLDGEDINLRQIKDGFAWHYTYQTAQTEIDLKTYADAQTESKYLENGLWSAQNPTPPWDFRKTVAVNSEFADKILGDKTSLIYFWKGCADFTKIGKKNRIVFDDIAEAETAGYTAAQDCPTPKPSSDPELDEDYDLPLNYEANNNYVVVPEPTPQTIYETRVETNETPQPTYTPAPTTNYSRSEATPSVTESRLPSALCNDGSYSYSVNNQGTCSSHGGVSLWLNGTTRQPDSKDTPNYTPGTTTRTKDVYVRGYTRRNGTYVAPYYRSRPSRKN